MASGSGSGSKAGNTVLGWIYNDGNIIQSELEGFVYDKPVSKHVRLDLSMNNANLCALLHSKLKIDSSSSRLRLFYRCKNPDDLKFGIVPIEDDDDVELMFGVVVSKGMPFFVEIYVEKLSCDGNLLRSSSSVGEKSSGRDSGGSRFRHDHDVVDSFMSVDTSHLERMTSFDDVEVANNEVPLELKDGRLFSTKEDLMHVVKQYHIQNQLEIGVIRSDPSSWYVACKYRNDGCIWKLKARKRSSHGKFQIMESVGPHSCLSTTITRDHPNLTSSEIAGVIKSQIVADPTIKEKVLLATAKDKFGYEPGRKKIRNANKIAMEDIHDSWEGSYEDLPHLMEALQSFNVGTKVDWCFREDDAEQLEEVTFKRLFWAFKPCIDGFEYCRPVILIDETHLYGPYPGVLLSATAVDGFSDILPLAFAIVESENNSSWDWFMDRLRSLVVGRRHGICVISDKHLGIMASMQKVGWCEPLNHHRYCVRHFATNFATKFKKARLKDRLVELAYQVQPKKFELLWGELLALEPRALTWFEDKPVRNWSLAHDHKHHRFGIMTTNHVESWNKAIVDARRLPLTSLVRVLFHKTVEYFDQRRLEIATQVSKGQIFTKYASHFLNRAIRHSTGHSVKIFDRGTWLFQMNFHAFVGDWYKLENQSKIYNGIFEPIPNKGDPRYPTELAFPRVVHDPDMEKKKGRRKATRYMNEMDFQSRGKHGGASSRDS
ncbi:uncharacterized protein LOC135147164 [Daucus carota subsp. sativus]|uniref:uncharacterized protein LOC135147164 n=1 Tax=Daucus carota subsp. sativus TaxID=79200 RepID=UPI0030832C83